MQKAAILSQPDTSSAPAAESRPLTGAQLADILGVFARVIERRSTIPVLRCVELCADGRTLTIAGTDMDLFLTCRIPFTQAKFKAIVRHDALANAAEVLRNDCPAFEVSSDRFVLRGSAGEFSIESLDDDLPEFSRAQPDVVLDLEGAPLKRMIDLCRPAISTEETRYYLMGISIRMKDEALECAATDGHRLHVVHYPVPKPDGEMPQIILRAQAARVLSLLLQDQGLTPVTAEISQLRASFQIGDKWTLESKCIDGTYPDYDRVIPRGTAGTFTFAADDLSDALKTIQRVGGPDCIPARLDLKACKVSFRSNDGGVCFERCINGVVEGDVPALLGFRPRYAAEILATHANRNASMRFAGADAAAPILIDFEDVPNFFAALMPCRV